MFTNTLEYTSTEVLTFHRYQHFPFIRSCEYDSHEPFAYAALGAIAVLSATSLGLKVETAVQRTKVEHKILNPAITASLSTVLGPPSLNVPNSYDKMVRPYRGERILNVSVGLKVKRESLRSMIRMGR